MDQRLDCEERMTCGVCKVEMPVWASWLDEEWLCGRCYWWAWLVWMKAKWRGCGG